MVIGGKGKLLLIKFSGNGSCPLWIHTCIYDFIVAKCIEYLAIISPSGFEVILLLPSLKFINPVHANVCISVKHKSEMFNIVLNSINQNYNWKVKTGTFGQIFILF